MNDRAILADPVFWGRIAGAVTGSLGTAAEKDLRRHWIDDMIPEACKRTNGALCVEGVAHLMGNPNGRFGEYRFFASVSWRLVRNPDQPMVIEALELDHDRKQLVLTVTGVPTENSFRSEVRPSGSADGGK